MKMKELVDAIERIPQWEGGDVPAYAAEAGRKYIYVCLNNGQFHRGDAPQGNGAWATYCGKLTYDQAVQWLEFRSLLKKGEG